MRLVWLNRAVVEQCSAIRRAREPIDVQGGESEAFHANGSWLGLEVVSVSRVEKVKVSRSSEAPLVPDAVRSKLKRYYGAMGEWLPEYDLLRLDDVVTRLCERFARM